MFRKTKYIIFYVYAYPESYICVYKWRISKLKSRKDVCVTCVTNKQYKQMENHFRTWIFVGGKSRGGDFRFDESELSFIGDRSCKRMAIFKATRTWIAGTFSMGIDWQTDKFLPAFHQPTVFARTFDGKEDECSNPYWLYCETWSLWLTVLILCLFLALVSTMLCYFLLFYF